MKIKRHLFPTIILGGFLLFGLMSPAFVGASIIPTGPTTTTTHPLCHNPSCTTTTTHPLCHDPSCTKYTCNSNYQCVTASNGEYTSLTSCQNNCVPPPPTRYTCNSNYQCVTASNGQYTSLSTCQTNCKAPCTKYTCNSNYQCVVASNGQYTSLTSCQNNCVPPPPTRYTCNSNYQCVVDSNGQYTSLSTCNANCNAPIRYACNTNTYQCYQSSSGPYASLNNCEADCQAPIRYSCNTNTYQCYQTTSGDYSNFNDCATNCQPPVTRYTCNSNYQCVTASNGEYTSFNTCQNNCIAPTKYSCNYSTYQCYQTTSGAYISYNDCANACQQTNQSLSISCHASPNPAEENQTVTFSSNVSGGSGNYSYYWSGATYGSNSYSQKSFNSDGNYTAYLTVHDSQNQSASTSCSVSVNEQYINNPTLNLWADKYTINQGESTYLRWTSTNANYCVASTGWTGNKSTNGYESVSPNSDTTYSLTCYGNNGQVSRSVTIYVTSTGANLSLTKLGRNLSNGDRVYSKVIRVAQGDIIEFYLTVTAGSSSDLQNVVITDNLPSVFSYQSGTTKVNDITQVDGITTTGLSLGTIPRGTSKTIIFQALSTNPGTYLTYTNTAQVTASGVSAISDSATITFGLVAGAATIKTGAKDSLLISIIISLISSIMIWYYLKFNPKGKLAFVAIESKARDFSLAYLRRKMIHQNRN